MSATIEAGAAPATLTDPPGSRKRRLVVIGGGISGLAAAHAAAEEAGDDLEIVILEKESEVGGKARSWRSGDWLVEGGPTGYTHTEPEFLRWIDRVGLTPDCLPASAAAARRYVYFGGRLREIPLHPLKLARSGLLSVPGMLRALREPWVSRGGEEDESLKDFATRRLGPEIADRLIGPMALGIYAGDAGRLSVRAAFPKIAELEREHGSLIRGAIAIQRRRRRERRANPGGGGMGGPALSGLRYGMQSLPMILAARGRFQVQRATPVREVARVGDGYEVRTESARWPADAVMVAVEPWAAANLLENLDAEIARELSGIACPPVTVVAFGFSPEVARRSQIGFGALVRRGEGVRMLGVLWDSQIFPGRAPADHLLVRLMYGGAVDPAAGDLDEGEIGALARTELARVLGWEASPVFEHVVRWPRAIPQYEIGHQARVARIEERLALHPGLYLTGNGLRGVAFARAAADGLIQGQRAGKRFASLGNRVQ